MRKITPEAVWTEGTGMGDGERDEGAVATACFAAARHWLASCAGKVRECLGDLDDAQVWWRPRASLHSIGDVVLHLCCDLRRCLVSGVGASPEAPATASEPA